MKTSILFVVFLIFAKLSTRAQEIAQTNIEPLANSVSLLTQLQPVRFNYDPKWTSKLNISNKARIGFVATDVQKVLPELITKTAKFYPTGKNASATATITSVDYESLIPLLVGSIKELQQQVAALKQEVDTLKSGHSK